MSRLQRADDSQHNTARPRDNLTLNKSPIFTYPEEILGDQTLTIADKRSLLASWASDALEVEDSPLLHQLQRGAVVCVDDIIAALKTLDLHEPRHEASRTFSQSFARRRSKPVARRRDTRPEDDNDPPPSAASARLSSAWRILTGALRESPSRYLGATNEPPASATGHSREISIGGRSAA